MNFSYMTVTMAISLIWTCTCLLQQRVSHPHSCWPSKAHVYSSPSKYNTIFGPAQVFKPFIEGMGAIWVASIPI